ncbi:MAG: porin, partial [Alphaproteobacteria bacterium]
MDFQAGIMNDDLDANQRNHAFRNDTEISVKVDGKTDSGLGYGGEVWLEADVEGPSAGISDARNQGVNASKTFTYLEGNWGRAEMGSNVGPDATMKVDASTIARATGGIDGSFDYFSNAATIYLARPDLPMNYGLTSGVAGNFLGNEDQENATKLTYYTPRWNGLQAGISYAPADTDRGQLIARADNTAAITVGAAGDTFTVSQAEGIWQGGLSWEGNFQNFGIALAATGEAGNAELATHEDLRAWALGGSVSYMGFSLAGSYGDWS